MSSTETHVLARCPQPLQIMMSLALVAVLILATACTPQQTEPAAAATASNSTNATREGVIRPFIQSSDMTESLEFYRDLLGFKVILIADYDNERIRAFSKIDGNATPRVALLSDDGTTLAFTIFSATGLEVDRQSNTENAPKFIIERRDINGIYKNALAAGVEVVFEPHDALNENGQLYARELGLISPEGIRILLLEKFNVDKPKE